MKKRNWLMAATVIGLGTTGFMLKHNGAQKPPVEIDASTVNAGRVVQKVNATGKIQPRTQVKISADVSARITRMDVKEGDYVKKGQFLLELDRERSQASVESQEATVRAAQSNAKLISENVTQAQRVLKRSRELFAKKLESQSNLDAAEAGYQMELARYQSALDQVEQSKGLLKQARDGLSKTTIYAPMSGTISALNKEVGEIVIGSQFQGDIIMVIAELGEMEALVNVDESDITNIKLGQDAEIEVDALLGQVVTGKVTEIASSARQAKQGEPPSQKTEFEVKIGITSAADKLRPGMTASADIVTETRESTLNVPLQSVTVRTLKQLQGEEKAAEANSSTADVAGKSTEKKDELTLSKDGETYTADKDGFVQLVFVISHDKVRARQVKTGIQSDDAIEIIDGLKIGEEVVSGSYRAISRDLNDGDAVTREKSGNKVATAGEG